MVTEQTKDNASYVYKLPPKMTLVKQLLVNIGKGKIGLMIQELNEDEPDRSV